VNCKPQPKFGIWSGIQINDNFLVSHAFPTN
jgi:hypothetical protein